MDEHCQLVSDSFPGLEDDVMMQTEDSSQRGEVLDDFAHTVEMEWSKRHNEVNELFRLVFEEHKFAAEAAWETGIVVSTAQHYVRKARLLIEEKRKQECMEIDEDEVEVPTEPVESKERKYGNQKLFNQHTAFFLDFYEENAEATLKEAREAVMKAFPARSTSQTE
ncbi:hypothetical protein BC941DRAFT_456899 [Chlamydoabsidia padenii]|nr:hypothetical protein BC941DRAFT_456899 [Chlamydoabsidia padenii]